MTTLLDKTLKRELTIDGHVYTVTLSPEALTLTLKGRRKGVQLAWRALVNGEAALAAALNASLGQLPGAEPPAPVAPRDAAAKRAASNRPRSKRHALKRGTSTRKPRR